MASMVTIVAVGATGHGKSSLGNALASGRSRFETSDSFHSETITCSHTDIEFGGTVYRYIDTVGFFDTRMSAKDVYEKFVAFSDRAPFGVDVFLFLDQKGRFSDENLRRFNLFKEYVGKDALPFTILVLTHIQNEKLQIQLERDKNESTTPETLAEVLGQVRCVVGAESKMDPSGTRAAVFEAVQKVRELNGGKTYSNEALIEARSRRDRLSQIVDTLSSDRKMYMGDWMRDLLNGSRKFDDVRDAVSKAAISEEQEKKEKQNQEVARQQAVLAAQQAQETLHQLRQQHAEVEADAQQAKEQAQQLQAAKDQAEALVRERSEEALNLRSALDQAEASRREVEVHRQNLQRQVEIERLRREEDEQLTARKAQAAREAEMVRSLVTYAATGVAVMLLLRWMWRG